MSAMINVVVIVHFLSPTSKPYLVSSPKKFKVFLKELVMCQQGLCNASAPLSLFMVGSFVLAIGLPDLQATAC